MPLRVLSLLSSATEMVYALGAGDLLIGRSHECDYPQAVSALPVVSKPLIDPDATSREIDRAVKERLRSAVSIYEISLDKLRELRPDIILTQTQCEVCAVSLSDVERALETDLGFAPKIVSLQPNSLSDIWSDILSVAKALQVEVEGERLVIALQARLKQIEQSSRACANRPTVFTVEWIDPLMTAGNWMPELIALAGATDLRGEAGKHSPWSSFADLAQADPDLIAIFPCGFTIARTIKELTPLLGTTGWDDLRAVQLGEVYLIDGNHFCNRPGPRIVETTEILAEIAHPESFSFGHEGFGWRRLSSFPKSTPAENLAASGKKRS